MLFLKKPWLDGLQIKNYVFINLFPTLAASHIRENSGYL